MSFAAHPPRISPAPAPAGIRPRTALAAALAAAAISVGATVVIVEGPGVPPADAASPSVVVPAGYAPSFPVVERDGHAAAPKPAGPRG